MVERGRPHITIWRTREACWVTKAINRNSEYVILIFFHYNSVYTKAPKCYFIHTLPVLLPLVANNTE